MSCFKYYYYLKWIGEIYFLYWKLWVSIGCFLNQNKTITIYCHALWPTKKICFNSSTHAFPILHYHIFRINYRVYKINPWVPALIFSEERATTLREKLLGKAITWSLLRLLKIRNYVFSSITSIPFIIWLWGYCIKKFRREKITRVINEIRKMFNHMILIFHNKDL